MLEQKELISEFENFLNERGLWYDFKDYANEKGYELSHFGMEDD